jgi:hypothetical protein
MSRTKVTLTVIILSAVISFAVYEYAQSNGTPLFTEEEWTYGDPLIARGVTRKDTGTGTYDEKAYAYTNVGEIIGTAADWYSYASVEYEPSDDHHQSDYYIKVSLLQSISWIIFPDEYKREKKAKSVEGDVNESESIFMFLMPLPDNMNEVTIEHCDARSSINGVEARIQ